MIILSAHVEGPVVIENVCDEAAKLCNRLGIGLDLTIGEHKLSVRAGNHPYNLKRAYERAERAAAAREA
ncbi:MULTISPECIES: hypothetical protein [Sphingobium]|uniref:hypothetical protein n=1 Tax=Sphingobium TaxID=165695 RepID=UPI0007807EFE|nr:MULTISPECIES: hypothetical protein [Sphingobium]OAP29826.1 hypothetical protein A8O16_21565 [Sphingobium sp. 20006FA]KXU30191.1 hypothetical protein AXW74_18970 [Sphingobium sp. AM]KYC30276.1 hypothetical protein A0J57_21365 [Sphingobium sp. 22B]MCB4861874.1 hypothetical protein [Sphingobium sp. PNB]NML91128.1 hypothetical protein [Sphingobium sp. TB-6]